jgi:hypothetical protein
MAIITFFYLLRIGECTGNTSDDTALRICNLELWIGNLTVPIMTAPVEQILASTSASLYFTTQMNGVRGELVNHAYSGASHRCPVMALV